MSVNTEGLWLLFPRNERYRGVTFESMYVPSLYGIEFRATIHGTGCVIRQQFGFRDIEIDPEIAVRRFVRNVEEHLARVKPAPASISFPTDDLGNPVEP